MGGAPSRETLVCRIVRDPRVERLNSSAAPADDAAASALASQQPEIILIPLIPDYFPSSTSPLFQQLIHVRREPTVSYYYRDARSTAAEHTAVHTQIGSDKDLYNWYMSLSEQRLVETDNELIALSRAGRVVSPVPCAVAFVYNTDAGSAGSALSTATTVDGNASPEISSDGTASPLGSTKRRENGKQKHKQYWRGKFGGSGGSSGGGGFNNGYMTIENTVRVPHHNLRVRIFGFVGDTRFCPASMQPSQAAKLPMCLTIFLSKSAGGNHRTQVTLLAAHTYLRQLQEIGVLRHIDGPAVGTPSLTGGAAFPKGLSSPATAAAASTGDMDPLASMRGKIGASPDAQVHAEPYADPYADPYSIADRVDPYATAEDEEQQQQQQQQQYRQQSHMPTSVRFGGLGVHAAASMADVAKETILRRPVEVKVHRADVPALCYLRELRARMAQAAGPGVATLTASPTPSAENEEEGGDEAPAAAAHVRDPEVVDLYEGEGPALRRLMQTVVQEEELRGTINAESTGRVLLWASRFYARNFEQLVGGEAARLRQELAQRNLSENLLDGTLSLTEDEPRPPKVNPGTGDVWITPQDTYIEVCGEAASYGGANTNMNSARRSDEEAENWKTVPAGTVLRYSEPESGDTARGAWRVSVDEFAEDILLSLCRSACHASRRAAPTDERWLMHREAGLPEGLAVGLLIWREPAAGQVVYYGTTPEFLKTWMQSGAELESAYRHQVKRVLGSAAKAGAESARDGAAETSGAAAAAASDRRPSSITVNTTGSFSPAAAVAATVTAASRGLRSSYENNSPANLSGVSSGPHSGSGKGSGKGRGQGSGSSSMALYSVRTGFVGASDQGTEAEVSAKASPASMAGQAAAAGSSHRGESSSSSRDSSAGDSKTKARRARTENAPPASLFRANGKSVAPSSTPARSPHSPCGSVNSQPDVTRLSHSVPAHQRSHFAGPVASSVSVLCTPNSSTSSLSSSSRSYTNLGYADQLGVYTGCGSGTPMRFSHLSSPFVHQQQQQQQYYGEQRAASVNLASACWIGVPDRSSADGANTPTVNVVVKQRRNSRLTPSTSMQDQATAATGSSAMRVTTVQGGSYTRAQARSDVISVGHNNKMMPQTQTIRFGEAGTSVGVAGRSAKMVRGSLPINIFGARRSSSEDGSFQHGGHSPGSQGQSRALLRGGGAPISHNGGHPDSSTRHSQQQASAAMDIYPSGGDGAAMNVGTPQETSTSLRWTTSSAAQPAPMRGASVTFASGSSRQHSLLHHSRYQEPCQPVLSRPASFSASEVVASSFSSTGSFRKKDACRPPSLFPGDVTGGSTMTPVRGAPAPTSNITRNGTPASHVNLISSLTRGPTRAAAPIDVAFGGMEPQPSLTNSAVHTPRVESLGDSAKSSVGSGKYRWDWRGVSWSS